jgi:stearoyl-CoA desaturase (delta-9 desaturase)
MKAILIFFVAQWYISLFFQTFFHHRYSAHKMFTMSKAWEKVFFFFSWITQGSSFLSPYAYGLMHRMHHAYADTEKDVHSPKYDSNLFTMMFRTKKIYSAIFLGQYPIEDRFKKDLPECHSFEKFASSMPVRLFWAISYFVFYYHFIGDAWYLWFLLPLQILMSPVHGAVINWFAHKFGYRNFEVADTSMNFLPVDFLMLGESYHNNHHKFGGRANFGHKWHEIDPVYQFIKIFNAVGIIKLNKANA